MKGKLLLLISLLSASLLFNGCTKEGATGPTGKDGNANVQSSTLTFSTWSWDASSKFEYCDFTWPAITSSIVNSGALLLYINTANGWAQLPRTLYPATAYTESQRFVYNVGTFKVIVQDSDLSEPNPALGTWTVKIVVIESFGAMKKANPDLDWNNYTEVKTRLNLAD